MKRIWSAAAVLLLAGCGVQPSGVVDGGEAPTGLAPGVTLYFVDANDELQPQQRDTGRLGTIAEAMSLLLLGPGHSAVYTGIAPISTPRVVVTTTTELIELTVPFTIDDVTPVGLDQIVCTALGVHVQGGGSKTTQVQVRFVQPTPESAERRTCPLIN
ncbi:hypothetical protein UA75_21180 [Actinoalloteichus sp. GBA129-24]|nr:hypothetical protein UA75_21180 [Actinoalloteichus sp. GBA129-24]